MRKRLQYIMALALTIVMMSACKHDDVEWVTFDDPSIFCPTVTETEDISKGIPSCPQITALESETETKTTSIGGSALVKELFDNFGVGKIHAIAGTYWSTDQFGDSLRLSGKIFLPAKGEIKNIILVSHFTICADYECPSRSFQLEGMYALDGYAVVMADYIGYGASVNRTHPYLCSYLTAKNVVDMLDAVVPYLKKIGREPESDEIYLLGYSQGGATTMAVQRLLEQPTYQDKYKVRRNFAGAGPYDIAQTYDTSIEIDKTGIPCAIPMIIMGLNEGERLHLDYSVYFNDYLMANYEEWINSKKYTTNELRELMKVSKLSELMTDSAMQKRDPKTVTLYDAMLYNSVILGWKPQAPVYMFHSQDDDTVPFINSVRAKASFSDCNIEYNFGHYGSHVMGCLRFLMTVHSILKEEK